MRKAKEEQIKLAMIRIKQALNENKDGLTRSELIELCGSYVPFALRQLIINGEVEREKVLRNVYYVIEKHEEEV